MDRIQDSRERGLPGGGDLALGAMPVAVAIALLLLVAAAGLRSDGSALRQRAMEVDAAVAAAEAKLQDLRSLPFDAVIDGRDSFRLTVDHEVERVWRVRHSHPAAGLRTVEVEIDGLRHGAPPVRLAFVLAPRRS